MTRNTIINPLTRRAIQIGRDTYNRLIITAYDHINGELVRRESAPPLASNIYYFNVLTNRSIRHGSRRYNELMQAGWEIEDGPGTGTAGEHRTSNVERPPSNMPNRRKLR